MKPSTLYRRSLIFHARSHIVVALAVATGCAVLTGALLVGDSMRGSLREMAERRLGPIDYALISPLFISESLGSKVGSANDSDNDFVASANGVLVNAVLTNADSKARANSVDLYGVTSEFFNLFRSSILSNGINDDEIALSAKVAREIGVSVGADVLIFFQKSQLVPAETLLGRKDDFTASTRLKVSLIIEGNPLSNFSLSQGAIPPLNAFVSLTTLQRAIKQANRINAVFVRGQIDYVSRFKADSIPVDNSRIDYLQQGLKKEARPNDYYIQIRPDTNLGYIALETKRLLLEPPIEEAANAAAKSNSLKSAPILTYLVNSIELKGANPDHPITPYSVATAVSSTNGMTLLDGKPAPELQDNEVLLNSWTAEDLVAKVGDTLVLKYYISKPYGKLEEATSELKVAGIVKIEGLAADRTMTPEYEGITNTKRLSEWAPPFPMDMTRIRPKDEDYWDKYRGTPKLFVSLKTGEKLWAESDARYGRYTAIRLYPPAGVDLTKASADFEKALLTNIDPARMGLSFQPVRQQALAAASGNTDFGGLFIGFSSFLIIAAMLLVALVFRLGIERRADEIGLLLANGFTRRQVTGLMLKEGLIVAAIGTVLGLVAAVGYAKLMLAGLRIWNPVGDAFPPLSLFITPQTLLIGAVVSFLLAALTIILAIRGLTRLSPRALLSGIATQLSNVKPQHRQLYRRISIACLVIAIIVCVSVATGASQAVAFFSAGALLLIAGLTALRAWMSAPSHAVHPGHRAIPRLGVANARRNPGRSMLTAALIACATFVIIAVGANRQTVSEHDYARGASLGGFRLMAQSVVPVAFDLNTPEGRASTGLSTSASAILRGTSIQSFRLQPGDDASCLNLYQVRRPRIVGAPESMIRRGGFTFASTMNSTREEKLNPWNLLLKELDDGAIPAIGDANTVQWLLHLGIDKDLMITDERGVNRPLRIVATLSHSVLQGELIIGEDNFKKLFPSVSGYSFFLIDSPAERTAEIEQTLEKNLAEYGLDVSSTAERLAGYLAIENMYISTFQLLGGLGLILGTIGLGVVMLRNIYERRGELALLRALGLSKNTLGKMVLWENLALLIGGLLIGLLSALAAVAPHILLQPTTIPWASLSLTLLGVLFAGLLAGLLAVISTTRLPLLPALRAE